MDKGTTIEHDRRVAITQLYQAELGDRRRQIEACMHHIHTLEGEIKQLEFSVLLLLGDDDGRVCECLECKKLREGDEPPSLASFIPARM